MKNEYVTENNDAYIDTKYLIQFASNPYRDKTNEYVVNSSGMRSPELSTKADILICGCSYSFGVGVPENMSWGVQVANKLGLPYHNISVSGKGVPYLINNIFSYFKIYGHPKILVCLFPEVNRVEISSNPKYLISENFLNKDSSLKDLRNSDRDIVQFNSVLPTSHKNQNTFSKIPHVAEDVFPVETAMSLSFQYIKFLEMYCKQANIKLVWAVWDSRVQEKIIEVKSGYENFISIDTKHWHSRPQDSWHDIFHFIKEGESHNPHLLGICDKALDCHAEFRDKYGDNWDIASDIDSPGRHHWGIHRHMHVAESFLMELNDHNIGS